MTETGSVTARVEAGREALRRYAWREAYDLLTEADTPDLLTTEDLEGLSQAAWWTGRLDRCIEAAERAFSLHVAADRNAPAARVALGLARDNYTKGASAVGAAWLTRAEKLLADQPERVEHGYLARLRAVLAFEGRGDIETGLAEAERALEISARFGDRDLQALALCDRGRMLVDVGRVSEGMALMDEATVAAVSGELHPLATGFIYCNTISACEHIADYVRAGEWTEAAGRWCERQAIAGFPGMCRVHRAGIMRLRGAWADAEKEARTACVELREFSPGYAGEAFYELGELRLQVGDPGGAEDAFRQATELGREPEPGVALLRLAQGKIDAAVACITRALAEESREVMRARLLPARVEIALAASDLDGAAEAAALLDAIAEQFGTAALKAQAACAQGVVALARDDATEAARSLRHGLQLWQEVDAPYEVARTRVVLASAYRAEGDEEAASQQLEAARATFERLGAVPDARRAVGLIDEAATPQRRALKTFMFTDICKSSSLVEAIGDDAWQDLLRWHDQTLRSLFAGHGGEEVDHAGDGFFVAFDDAVSAVDCAVAMQRTLAEHRRTHGFAPQVRIGLHASEATQGGDGYRGKGVHEAARIAALAQHGEILASCGTLRAAGVPAGEARAVTLRGIAQPIEVAAVPWR